jgi:hypothetical protein
MNMNAPVSVGQKIGFLSLKSREILAATVATVSLISASDMYSPNCFPLTVTISFLLRFFNRVKHQAEAVEPVLAASFADFAGFVETNRIPGTVALLAFRPASNPDFAYVFRTNPRDAA